MRDETKSCSESRLGTFRSVTGLYGLHCYTIKTTGSDCSKVG